VLAGKLSKPDLAGKEPMVNHLVNQTDQFQDAKFIEKLESAVRSAVEERKNKKGLGEGLGV
jgi:hypothetical protein